MKSILIVTALWCSFILAAINIADYGAGPMLKPARTFYVSTRGNNKNDGKTLKTAFRSISYGATRLRAGDTLLVEGGEYFERTLEINVKDGAVGFKEQCGRPGAPIRIMGMKGHKVLLRGGPLLSEMKKDGVLREFKWQGRLIYNMVQEYPSGIELQRVYSKKIAREYPGTFFYDEAKKRLSVHFAALDQTHAVPGSRRIGIRIHGSYIHLENLHFSNFYEPIYIRMNRPYDKNAASHITILNCTFFNNYKNGIVLDGASWSLIKNNRLYGNTGHGSIMTQKNSHDNLITGNWCGPSPQTLRQDRINVVAYGINNYGGMPPRNHVIGNVVDNALAFRWKAGCPGSLVRDNIFRGRVWAESPAVPSLFTNNLMTGKVGWMALGGDIWDKEFAPTPVKFYGNVKRTAKFVPVSPELAKAKALAMDLPRPRFPEVKFTNLKADFIATDSAAVCWMTPERDGWGSVELYTASGKRFRTCVSQTQGVKHFVGVDQLKPGTTYKYRAAFTCRRTGKRSYSGFFTFTTALKNRAPKILEVGHGKYSLEEANIAALPGDTIKLLPGTHSGVFSPIRSGVPGKPITLLGKGAKLSGEKFHAPMIVLKDRSHIIIDGVTFIEPESTARLGIIRVEGGRNVTIRNCHAPRFSWYAGQFAVIRNTPGTVIQNNIIHGGDYPIATVGPHIRILNNTIVDATMLTLSIWDPANMEIRNNIFYRPCIPAKRNQAMTFNAIKGKIISEGNVFWSPVKEHPMGGRIRDHKNMILKESKTLQEWQKISGMDKTSIHADPMFVNYEKGDFRLKPGSPAKGKGASL